jgi:iron complex transport system substrate-binding protein
MVMLGAVPVINGFLFALGRQDALVNGLPPELARKFQYVFAPELAGKPVVQGAEKGLAVEDIIGLKPEGATPDIRLGNTGMKKGH